MEWNLENVSMIAYSIVMAIVMVSIGTTHLLKTEGKGNKGGSRQRIFRHSNGRCELRCHHDKQEQQQANTHRNTA